MYFGEKCTCAILNNIIELNEKNVFFIHHDQIVMYIFFAVGLLPVVIIHEKQILLSIVNKEWILV